MLTPWSTDSTYGMGYIFLNDVFLSNPADSSFWMSVLVSLC